MENDVHCALVGVPASFDELERDVDDRLVVEEPSTQKPVATMEAGQVRTDVSDLPVVIEIGEIDVVPNG